MSFTIMGTGSALPDFVLTNEQLAGMVDTSDEWITTRTGIKERHICTDETLLDLALKAAKQALNRARVPVDELDLIICSTVQGDNITPSLACMLQGQLYAKCPAFDINAACSGFIYALDVASAYLTAGKANRILLVSAEEMSRFADWQDRSTCVLFGDGAGAVVLSKGDDLLAVRLTSEGNEELLRIGGHTGNSPFKLHKAAHPFLEMNGREIYKFAVNAICRDITDVLAAAGIESKDIGHVLLHQANMRIMEAAQVRLGIKAEKFLTTIDRYGNTSSASIPIMLADADREGLLADGELLVLSAFGGGLTTGACVLRWNKNTFTGE